MLYEAEKGNCQIALTDSVLKNGLREIVLSLIVFCVVSNGARTYAADANVVAKAKTEGEVVLYTAWGLDTVQELQKEFAKKYPIIKVDCGE
jgi:hypothetical protein